MQSRRIATLEVSLVGLGCNNFGMRIDEPESVRVVHAAIDAGITFFDTADIYGSTNSEVYLGHALAGRRDSVVIATKFGMRVDGGLVPIESISISSINLTRRSRLQRRSARSMTSFGLERFERSDARIFLHRSCRKRRRSG